MQAVSIFFAKLGIGSLIRPFGVLVIIGTPFLLHRGPSLKVDARVDPNLPAPGTFGGV